MKNKRDDYLTLNLRRNHKLKFIEAAIDEGKNPMAELRKFIKNYPQMLQG